MKSGMNSENKNKIMQDLWKYENMGNILKIWVKFSDLVKFWKSWWNLKYHGKILKILTLKKLRQNYENVGKILKSEQNYENLAWLLIMAGLVLVKFMDWFEQINSENLGEVLKIWLKFWKSE